MNQQTTRDTFLESATNWICDSYSLGIHYLAVEDESGIQILDATLFLYPYPPEPSDNFSIKAGDLRAGRRIFPRLKKAELLKRLVQAAKGAIDVHDLHLTLHHSIDLNFYSATPGRDVRFHELHLSVTGSLIPPVSHLDLMSSENELRLASPPFDGLSDLCSWLQLSDTRTNGQASSITLRIGPPVDVIFDQTQVNRNILQVTLSAHSHFNIDSIELALREFPGQGIETRKHVGDLVTWKRGNKGRRTGTLKLTLINANSVLIMLVVGGRTVRRRWFDDPDKAVNSRFVATQLFDKDLKQLKLVVLDSTDAFRFEKGIASLLHLLGFASAIQIETEAPDIIINTPEGRLAIVECTTKISDFQKKLGKLVDRRNALTANLELTGHNFQVGAFLVCGLPRGQIAVEERLLTQHQVTLLCKEDLARAFEQLRTPTSPDEMFNQAASRLT